MGRPKGSKNKPKASVAPAVSTTAVVPAAPKPIVRRRRRRAIIVEQTLGQRVDSMIAELTKLWNDGLATSEIGKRLGISKNAHTDQPGPEGSMMKLHYADLAKRVYHLGMEILGQYVACFNDTTYCDARSAPAVSGGGGERG